jgi:AraC-like DNA-binding protein
MNSGGFCEGCFEKQRLIDQQKEEIATLKAKLRYQQRQASAGFFGSATPSAQKPLKPNSLEENQKKCGGAKPGHLGHGRKKIAPDQADHRYTIEAPVGDRCPHCRGKNLLAVKAVERSVIESLPLKAEKVLYRLAGKLCLDCHRVFRAKVPAVLPKALYGNQLLTNVAVMHYVHGTPLGRLEELLGVPYSAMVQMLHRLGRLLSGVPPRLIKQYRRAPVKHADETGWRNDGANGYAWLFATEKLSIFEFRATRSSSVPAAILGAKPLPGTLVSDRYKGYNKVPCAQQYCYAHLHRTLLDLGQEFPDQQEVRAFVDAAAPLLAAAMALRGQPITDAEYYQQAARLARQIRKVMNAEAQHLGIRAYQDIFRDNQSKLYHWVKDRRVPADNNLAERDLRPSVIARKVSFGSQSAAGAKTRGILMTVLITLKKRYPNDYHDRFKAAFDRLAVEPSANIYQLLFSG